VFSVLIGLYSIACCICGVYYSSKLMRSTQASIDDVNAMASLGSCLDTYMQVNAFTFSDNMGAVRSYQVVQLSLFSAILSLHFIVLVVLLYFLIKNP